MAARYTFGKQERLKSSLAIQELLSKGRTVSVYPFKLYWELSKKDQKFPARAAISVPRKKFRRAVDRNLMKRRIREAYRLNKHLIFDPLRESHTNVILVILFLSDEFISFERLQSGMRDLLRKLAVNIPSTP